MLCQLFFNRLMRRIGVQWIPLLLYCLVQYCVSDGFVHANTDGTMFLERGQRGVVPCPLIKSRQILIGDILATYWYYGSSSDTSLLISYFLGRVAPQNGIPEGVYDIDNDFSLIIENVTASNEGTYYFQLNLRSKIVESGSVDVCDKVSPSRPYPTVIGCNQDHDADTCEVRVRDDSTVQNLTCVMEQVKPAVQLRWIRLFWGGLTKLNTSTTVRPVALPTYTGSSLRNNTFSTSASVQVAAGDDEDVYECEAMGVATGGNILRTRVRFAKTHPTTATYNEAHSYNNSETTLVSPISLKSTEPPVAVIILTVVILMCFVVILLMSVRITILKKKHNKVKRESKMKMSTFLRYLECINYHKVPASNGSPGTSNNGVGDRV